MNMFEIQFQPADGGFLYRPNFNAAAIEVTAEEREALIARHKKFVTSTLAIFAIFVAAAVATSVLTSTLIKPYLAPAIVAIVIQSVSGLVLIWRVMGGLYLGHPNPGIFTVFKTVPGGSTARRMKWAPWQHVPLICLYLTLCVYFLQMLWRDFEMNSLSLGHSLLILFGLFGGLMVVGVEISALRHKIKSHSR